MVYKMATVGCCTDEQSSGAMEDGEEASNKKHFNNHSTTTATSTNSQLVDICKKNGVVNCILDDKSCHASITTTTTTTRTFAEDAKKKQKAATKSDKSSRINGSNININNNSANKGLSLNQPSIPNLRSRKDKQQRPVIESPRKRRRSSRHEKSEQHQQQLSTTVSTTDRKKKANDLENQSINCCCLEQPSQGVNSHENNNASQCISKQANSKGSPEPAPQSIYGLHSIFDGLALNNERTKTAAGQVGLSSSTAHSGLLPSHIDRPYTPILSCSTASVSNAVNCALISSSSSSSSSCKDSQNFDYNCNKETVTHCKWKNCDIVLDPDLLMAHIREKHVESQEGSETYVCFWDGCKVYAKRSCSMSWLERHILSHSGDKPFKCIVDGCDMRFPSHHGLERHVNSHFNTQQPTATKPTKLREDTPTKLWKKKKLKRKRPQLVRTGDFFDSGIMERLQQELITLTRITQIDLEGSTNSITFHGTVIARRKEDSGKIKVLLHWTPENIFPDCWVPESQVQEVHKRVIPLTSLPQDSAAALHSSFYRRHRYRKHRRK
ncbi:zinc finger protein AEBP2-like isoform X1 [Argonauta hians]